MALKTSPDFHQERVELLIKQGDLEKMFNYVRDEIRLVPARANFRAEGRYIKHGIDGVLRTGIATIREKVELLAYMFNKAGYETEVVREASSLTDEDVLSYYLRPFKSEFNPNVNDAQLEYWKEKLEVHIDDVDLNKSIDEEAKKITENLFSNFEIEDDALEKIKIEWTDSEIPTLKFIENGEVRHAHLLDPNVPFGELKYPGAYTYAMGKTYMASKNIKLSLKGWHSSDFQKPIEMLDASWDLLDVIGKQINISFLKDLEIGTLDSKSLHQIQFFTPSFALQGVNDNASFLEERSTLGDPMTISGEAIILDENNPENYRAKLKYDRPVTATAVKTLECKAKALSFPKVRLEVSAKDIDDNLVEGLQVSNFQIKEDGQPVSALLKSNRQSPKILILSDTSLSMPKTYRDEGIRLFNKKLEKIVIDQYSNAKIEFWQTDSNLYYWLRNASQESADLIIYCTDGHVHDELDSRYLQIYKNGAPALILDVEENQTPIFQNLADITSGSVVPASDQERTAKAISDYLALIKPTSYIFEYNSRSRNKHQVDIQIFKSSTNAKDTYQFPEKNDIETGLISLQLDIQIGSKRINKTLAGADKNELSDFYYSKKSKKSLSTYRNEVRGFLLGGAQLYIESEGPTLANALSDVLTAQLSNRAWGEAFIDNDFKLAKKEFEKGRHRLSGPILSLLSQPKSAISEESITYANGYRLALSKTIWPIEDQQGSNSFDYFQSSDYRTFGNIPLENFKKTANITTQFAIREASLFRNSTLQALKNKELISNQKYKQSTDKEYVDKIRTIMYENGLSKKLLDYRDYILFDKNLDSFCYWKIDKNTGEIYGMLADHSGGGGEPIPIDPTLDDALSLLLNVVGILDKIMTIATAGKGVMFANPMAGASLALVAKYGVMLAKIYGIATQAIIVMDTAGMDEKIKKELQIFACQAYKEIIYNIYGNAGAIFSGLESLIGMLSPSTDSPFKCK